MVCKGAFGIPKSAAPMLKEITKDSLSRDLLIKTTGHKYDYGHLLVLSGGAGRSGAARLAAYGALRMGAGLVTIAAPPDTCPEIAAQITALMLCPVADDAALSGVLEDPRINAIAIGPGLGLSDEHAALVACVLKQKRRTVLDADALTLIAREKALFDLLHKECVLTPHDGEFARLFPDLANHRKDEEEQRRVGEIVQAVNRVGCCILRKGANTLISGPDGRSVVHRATGENAAAWLATAGSGDVLTGFIGGLLAKGAKPFDAATHAAWLHAACARRFGAGLIAEDLPEELPAVLRELS